MCDILVNRTLGHDELMLGLSKMFPVKTSEIVATDDIETISVSDNIRILCHYQSVDGDFCQLLSIFIRDKSIKRISIQKATEKFCRTLDCICLISDDKINPYTMIMITSISDPETIFLSHDHLEKDEYVVEYYPDRMGKSP